MLKTKECNDAARKAVLTLKKQMKIPKMLLVTLQIMIKMIFLHPPPPSADYVTEITKTDGIFCIGSDGKRYERQGSKKYRSLTTRTLYLV